MRRLLATLAGALSWPLRMLWRSTPDGGLFLLVALACGALAPFGGGAWTNIPLLICLSMLSLWLLAAWQGWRSLRALRIRRSHPEAVFASEPLNVTLHVANPLAWPAAGLVINEQVEAEDARASQGSPGAPQGAQGAARRVERIAAATGGAFVTVVPGGGQERARYTLTLRRRGIYAFGSTRVESVAPLGMVRNAASRRISGRLVVYPRMGEIAPVFFEELDLALQLLRRSRAARAEEDFRGLREYRQGDNPKWIHWKSTARLQTTLVKEFEEPQARRVLLAIDSNLRGLGMQRFMGLETAVSFAGTLARDLARRGCEVECVALQPQHLLRLTVSRERRNFNTLLEMLAGFKRDDRRTLADLIEHVGRRSLHNVFVLVIGLGSLRARTPLAWLNTGDNAVKVLDVRSDEFRRVFSRTIGAGSGAREEFDLLDDELMLGEPEEAEESVPTEASP